MASIIGINNYARTITNMYIGIDDKAQKVVNAYLGINNKAYSVFNSIQISITKPTIASAAIAQSDINYCQMTVTSSNYEVTDPSINHIKTIWKLCTVNDSSSEAVISGEITDNLYLTSFTTLGIQSFKDDSLTPNAKFIIGNRYYLFIKYISDTGLESEWSNSISVSCPKPVFNLFIYDMNIHVGTNRVTISYNRHSRYDTDINSGYDQFLKTRVNLVQYAVGGVNYNVYLNDISIDKEYYEKTTSNSFNIITNRIFSYGDSFECDCTVFGYYSYKELMDSVKSTPFPPDCTLISGYSIGQRLINNIPSDTLLSFRPGGCSTQNYPFNVIYNIDNYNLGCIIQLYGYIYWYFGTTGAYLNSNCAQMFKNFTMLNNIYGNVFGDYLNTSIITDTSNMFVNCTNLQEVTFSNKDGGISCPNLTNTCYMFSQCSKLKKVSITASKITDASYMFFNCQKLTTQSIISNNITSAVKLSYCFCNCTSLSSIELPNNISECDSMLAGCTSLGKINHNINCSSNLYNMYAGCNKIQGNINLGTSVSTVAKMFQGIVYTGGSVNIRVYNASLNLANMLAGVTNLSSTRTFTIYTKGSSSASYTSKDLLFGSTTALKLTSNWTTITNGVRSNKSGYIVTVYYNLA